MDRQLSSLGGANTMIGAAALESIRPVRQPRFDPFMFENAHQFQEAAPDPAAGHSQTEPPAGRETAMPLGSFIPPDTPSNRPPRQSGGVPAASDMPVPGIEARVFKSASPGSGGAEQIIPAAEAPRPGGAPARYRSDAPKTPADAEPLSAAPVAEPERSLPLDNARNPSRSASHAGVMFPGQAVAIDAPTAKAAPVMVLPPAGSRQTAAVSEPPEIDAEPPSRAGKAPNQHVSSLEALSALLNLAQRKPALGDVSARPRELPAHGAGMRASPPQVHIGTLEIRIEAPAPAKAAPARAPLPSSGPGIVSRLHLRSL